MLKPDVVFFGDNVPKDRVNDAFEQVCVASCNVFVPICVYMCVYMSV